MTCRNSLFLLCALSIGIFTSPSYAGDIISCDSFENCPDGSVPLTNALLELDARVDALEGATADLCALYQELYNQNLLGALQVPSYCPVTQKVKLVFTTDGIYNGNLGGLDGADEICQLTADDAGLTGIFKAWLSDSAASPSTRFTQFSGPYELVNGVRVADSWADLTDGVLAAPICVFADGTSECIIPYPANFTGSNIRGESVGGAGCSGFGPPGYCDAWTSARADCDAVYGAVQRSDAGWTGEGRNLCSQPNRGLYCFQQ